MDALDEDPQPNVVGNPAQWRVAFGFHHLIYVVGVQGMTVVQPELLLVDRSEEMVVVEARVRSMAPAPLHDCGLPPSSPDYRH